MFILLSSYFLAEHYLYKRRKGIREPTYSHSPIAWALQHMLQHDATYSTYTAGNSLHDATYSIPIRLETTCMFVVTSRAGNFAVMHLFIIIKSQTYFIYI